MTTRCKICSPFVPGLTGLVKGMRSAPEAVATQERVDNTRVTVLRGAGRGIGRSRAAFEILKLWENGRTLRCRFIDGEATVQARVEAIAKEWQAHANLTLNFVRSGL